MKKKLALLLLLALVLSIFSVVSWASTNSCDHSDVAEYSKFEWRPYNETQHRRWIAYANECRLCGETLYSSYPMNTYQNHIGNPCVECRYPEVAINRIK